MSKIIFKKVAFIGMGLIASSMARSMRELGIVNKIVTAVRSEETMRVSLELGLVNEAYNNISQAVTNADLVVIAIPLGGYEDVFKELSRNLDSNAIITDVGSVKEITVDIAKKCLGSLDMFVPGHPIAGTEHSGPRSGFSELFHNRWTILTPTEKTNKSAVEKIKNIWTLMGSSVDIMTPQHHDIVLAITSHLPHLIAYTIVGTATDLEEDLRQEVIKYSASGFRDFTRIAASDPVMWRDIFMSNKDATLSMLQRFSEDLTALQRAIRYDEGEKLEKLFARTRKIRRGIIEANQA
ncbi:MAG: cyclohexadienyl dehydrogenase [Alphaproteobacteria bacterium TMED87]|nr:cyclohexadienyl dehydrogenase [Rhodospirillaceae bacterium]OUV10723.1 MAG: cyclohexadienyl dehydrogenase [Alphaproteobacteria bacterium TMED87]|tara:strand:+ start:1103 stop:1987 length:885 start_codon:yes stop_codon:yes gene_type:complete